MTPGNMVYADKELGRFAVRNRNRVLYIMVKWVLAILL